MIFLHISCAALIHAGPGVVGTPGPGAKKEKTRPSGSPTEGEKVLATR